MSATVTVICNEKGGVSKTTTTAALADGLTSRGGKVLCIDLDPQPGNLSLALGADKESVIGAYEVFASRSGMHKPSEFVQSTGWCDVIAANKDLAHIEGLLATVTERHLKLRPVVDTLKESYSHIIIDTPPAFGLLTLNALAAADEVVIPTLADYYSVHGVVSLVNNIREFAAITNPKLMIVGVLVTQFRPNTILQSSTSDALRQIAPDLGVPVFSTYIRQSVAVQEAQSQRKTLSQHKASSAAAADYKTMVDEYLALQRKVA